MRGWASLADCIQSLQTLNGEEMVVGHETIAEEERTVPESVH